MTLLIGVETGKSQTPDSSDNPIHWVLRNDSVCTDTASFVRETNEIQKLVRQKEYLIERLVIGELSKEEYEEAIKALLKQRRRELWRQRGQKILIGIGSASLGFIIGSLK